MADAYIVESTLPGAQLLESMLITAYAHSDQVRLIDGYAYQPPRVVGVDIRRAI